MNSIAMTKPVNDTRSTTDRRKEARAGVRAARKLNADMVRSLHRALAATRAVQFELSDGPLADALNVARVDLERAIEHAGDAAMELVCVAIVLAPKGKACVSRV